MLIIIILNLIINLLGFPLGIAGLQKRREL
jgi:hypothetical protein